MKLIADGGSTKVKWALLNDSGVVSREFKTPGLNPLMLNDEDIYERIRLTPHFAFVKDSVDEIWFYGAGCIDSVIPRMQALLQKTYSAKSCHVASDMLGAARALCGHHRGIACVLGTGSNSCLFDGFEITDQISPLGYILGDEGSGAVLGRRLLGDIYKRRFDNELSDNFNSWLGMTRDEVIKRVYREPEANAFLASLVPFIVQNISHPQIDTLVTDEFSRFIRRNVMGYSDATHLPVHFTGSLAALFEKNLRRALDDCSLTCGNIAPDPLPGMVAYHQNKL